MERDLEQGRQRVRPVIKVEGLHKAFGTVQAVRGVSFSAADGAITGLLGPNGAGKTTTLRMLYTLMQPDQGRIEIDGIDAAVQPLAVRKRLGVLPDARGVYKRLTARENVEYFARLQGLDAATAARRSGELLQQLELADAADRRTEGFSQGQRLKTALARALVHDPMNIVLDEPTNGLDVLSTRALRAMLRTLRAQGRCVLVSTHIMQEVAELCDHIIIIARGVVVAQGSAAELRAAVPDGSLEDAFVQLIGAETASPT